MSPTSQAGAAPGWLDGGHPPGRVARPHSGSSQPREPETVTALLEDPGVAERQRRESRIVGLGIRVAMKRFDPHLPSSRTVDAKRPARHSDCAQRPTAKEDTVASAVKWTINDVLQLGLTTDLETAASILGIGRTKAYEMASDDRFPVRIIKSGRSYRVPVPAILTLLGVTTEVRTGRANERDALDVYPAVG